jgi:hypothetical protein
VVVLKYKSTIRGSSSSTWYLVREKNTVKQLRIVTGVQLRTITVNQYCSSTVPEQRRRKTNAQARNSVDQARTQDEKQRYEQRTMEKEHKAKYQTL